MSWMSSDTRAAPPSKAESFAQSMGPSDLAESAEFWRQTVTAQGIESQIKYKLPYDASVLLNHTWQNVVDANGSQLLRRAKHNFYASLAQNYDNGISGLIGIRGRSRIRTNSSGSEVAQGFITVRTALSKQFDNGLRVTLRAEHILDQTYEDVFGFSTQGASAFIGASYNFK